MDDRERRARGMEIRRAVLGEAHVERARAGTTDLGAEFQDLITRYAWGEIWARPGISRRTRSLLTVAMLVALNRPEELRLHLRAAAACGVTREELREVLLHAAVYCGVPAAHAAIQLAEAELPPGGTDPGNETRHGGEP
jgi:4-carboxymuconolactone decarboxylase